MSAALREATRTRMRAQRRKDLTRSAIVLAALVVLIVVLVLTSALLGRPDGVSAGQALTAMTGRGRGLADYVIFETRMPRAAGALLCGLLFGLAGHLYQSVVRNPLATPDIIGITAGATAGAVAVIVLAPGMRFGVQAAGLLGALAIVLAVFALTWRSGLDTYRLVLVGIGVSSVGIAVTNYLFTFAEGTATAAVLRWTTGSTSFAQWPDAVLLSVVLVVSLGLALALGRGLGALGLGDDLARGLGVRVHRVRVAVLVIGAAAAALTTSVVGPIGFVALISGPIATRLVARGPHLLLAPLVGAVLVLAADLPAQHAPLISPVPTGVLTALVGAPVFVWLLLRRRAGTS